MSPNGQAGDRKVKIPDNIYTVILGVACGVVAATAIFVLIQCYRLYGAVFTIS